MCSCLSGDTEARGSEHRAGRRPEPVSPWMEQVVRSWGRQARQRKTDPGQGLGSAKRRGGDAQNQDPTSWVAPGSWAGRPHLVHIFRETPLEPWGPSAQAAGGQGVSQGHPQGTTGPWGAPLAGDGRRWGS